jgi:hypothetical protein
MSESKIPTTDIQRSSDASDDPVANSIQRTLESVEDSKTKLNAYWEVLKIKPKKYKQTPSIDRLRKMMTQRQFDMLNINVGKSTH